MTGQEELEEAQRKMVIARCNLQRIGKASTVPAVETDPDFNAAYIVLRKANSAVTKARVKAKKDGTYIPRHVTFRLDTSVVSTLATPTKSLSETCRDLRYALHDDLHEEGGAQHDVPGWIDSWLANGCDEVLRRHLAPFFEKGQEK